ncbi:MAG: hypothetical protein LBD31_07715 [Treponema sp.]|nr:hypothetical protein [Treponema sp.]
MARRSVFRGVLIPVLAAAVLVPAAAQEWHRSNPAGMALERIDSPAAALHREWALSVEKPLLSSLPNLLKGYYNTHYSLELRKLYERGTLKRQQWIFRDGRGTTRLNASLPADPSFLEKKEGEENAHPPEGEIPPFIEFFSAGRSLTEIRQYLAAGIYVTTYAYRGGLLIRSDAFLDGKSLWTDQYRYTRSSFLREVERTYYSAGTAVTEIQGYNAALPGELQTRRPERKEEEGDASLTASLDLRTPPPVSGFVSSLPPYDSSIMSNVLPGIYSVPAAKVLFDTDAMGKVLSETRFDKDGRVLAEISNEWSGDRIKMILWSAGNDRGRVEFTYSEGERIAEEDYRNGVLERRVRVRGNEETEEIFLEEKLVLRALWREGRKVSEERIR